MTEELMREFAGLTGLTGDKPPRRYLWTDAFAVCNFLELYRRTGEARYRDLGLLLMEQVHSVLGRHREDDERTGWISGLGEDEGRGHPTVGGLRIGKKLKERRPDEPLNEELEWERDGQYYHYLTKWMHALERLGRVTADPACIRWAVELAKTAHGRFTTAPPAGGRKRMYWKMSIDLGRPLVNSMGQHDPLDGLVTFCEIEAAAAGDFPSTTFPDLREEIAELVEICRWLHWDTADPLGTGGLLFDAFRMAQLTVEGRFEDPLLLQAVVEAAARGLEAFSVRSPVALPAAYRLAFRELGLSIGLKGLKKTLTLLEENPSAFAPSLRKRSEGLRRYVPLATAIESFWAEEDSRESVSWMEHREINLVMLATSLSPGEFLTV